MTESRTEAATVFNRARIKEMTQGVRRLFMEMGTAEPDPGKRILNARAKIIEAQEYYETLQRHYPKGKYPRERFRKVYELFDRLKVSYEKA